MPSLKAPAQSSPSEQPSFPALTGRVVDAANLLSYEDRVRLETKLKEHEVKSSDQVVVATVPSLGELSIENYASRLFNSWRLGQNDKNNGVLLLVAPKERKVRIEVGYGLEGALTDAASGKIVDTVLVPKFTHGDFAGGIESGVDQMLALLQRSSAPSQDYEQTLQSYARQLGVSVDTLKKALAAKKATTPASPSPAAPTVPLPQSTAGYGLPPAYHGLWCQTSVENYTVHMRLCRHLEEAKNPDHLFVSGSFVKYPNGVACHFASLRPQDDHGRIAWLAHWDCPNGGVHVVARLMRYERDGKSMLSINNLTSSFYWEYREHNRMRDQLQREYAAPKPH